MKKNILSLGIIVMFGIYTVLIRTGNFSEQIFKPKTTPIGLVDGKTSTLPPGKNINQVSRNVDCVFVSSDEDGEEDYNDNEEKEKKGYYKCTTITITPPSNTTSNTPVNTNTMMGNIAPIMKPKMGAIWKDGTFIGDIVDAYYGNVQVSVTISSDKLLNISFLDYPQDRRTSLQKSNYAMPILKQEAISKQSANVNTVSSVTYTSEAFIKSLSSALTQAKI